jgi:hypothetical protein
MANKYEEAYRRITDLRREIETELAHAQHCADIVLGILKGYEGYTNPNDYEGKMFLLRQMFEDAGVTSMKTICEKVGTMKAEINALSDDVDECVARHRKYVEGK